MSEKSPMEMYEEFIRSLLERRMHYKFKLLEVDRMISKLNSSGLLYLVNMTEEDEKFRKKHNLGG